MKTIEVKSLGDLLDRTTPNEPDPASGRLRDTSIYRGVAHREGPLLSSLDRLGGLDQPHSKSHLEEHLLRNFIRYGKPFLPENRENLWEIMVIAEHHGLPTRLLDWTHSPLVAAHFATLAPGKTDRIVWRLNWKAVHKKFGLREVVFLVEDLDALLKERGLPATWEFLNCNIPAKQEFICVLEPPAITPRLAVQSGAFTLCSAKDRSLDKILEAHNLLDSLTGFHHPGQSRRLHPRPARSQHRQRTPPLSRPGRHRRRTPPLLLQQLSAAALKFPIGFSPSWRIVLLYSA